MSSSRKTENLRLNLWDPSDIPNRTDFNSDNEIVEKAMTEHTSNEEIHIDNDQRDMWTNFMYSDYYYGDGYRSRVIETGCPFDAMLGFIYADDKPPSIHYESDGSTHHYFAVISQLCNTYGGMLEKNMRDFTVNNSVGADIQNEYSNLNEIGVCYRYVLFRDNRIIESV